MKRDPIDVLNELGKAVNLRNREKIKELVREFMVSLAIPLNTEGLAAALNINRATVARWLSSGQIPHPAALVGLQKLAKSGGDLNESLSVEDLQYLIEIAKGLEKPMPVSVALDLVRLRRK